MRQFNKVLDHVFNVLMAVSLACMGTLVFVNVVLRYVFNSGLTFANEMSLYFFVWLTLIGAIGALRNNQHLVVDSLVRRLPWAIKILVYLLGNGIVLYILWLIFSGSLKLTRLNLAAKSAAVGLPMYLVYGAGLLMSATMGIIILQNIVRLFLRIRDRHFVDDLISRSDDVQEV